MSNPSPIVSSTPVAGPPPLPPRRSNADGAGDGGKSAHAHRVIEADYINVDADVGGNSVGGVARAPGIPTADASSPPPLPPRRDHVGEQERTTALGSPVVISPSPSSHLHDPPEERSKGHPLSPLAVEIIPATPQTMSPITPATAPAAVSTSRGDSHPAPVAPPSAHPVDPQPFTAPLQTHGQTLEPPSTSSGSPSSLPSSAPAAAGLATQAKQTIHEIKHGAELLPVSLSPPVGWTAATAVLVLVAYLRILPWWVVLAAVAGLGLVQKSDVDDDDDDDVATGKLKGDAKAAVQWVNHAMYALFPLVSTDVLTPFIDLLEDALLQKVPPIVTSVRLDAPALGNQPLLLTSMRPMTDEEWFASVSTPSADAAPSDEKGKDKSPLSPGAGKGHSKTLSAESNVLDVTESVPGSPMAQRHSRSGSDASTRASVQRTASRGSVASFIDPGEVKVETEKRRRRDKILHKIRRRQGSGLSGQEHPMDPTTPISFPVREGAPNGLHSTVVGESGAAVDDEVDEDNPLMGQYVNYQVGFEYRRRESTKRKGYGLHVLAYFGVGVRGVGKTELPVYIDMLRIRGTLNIRLLLSANPPFARTATISFPRLPEFDISAKPLTRSTFNAMHLPGMKPYVQASIADVARAFVRPNSYTVDVDRLLLGREAALRTASIGVLHVIIHSAEDLPKTDTVGTCDPYTSVSFAKYHKPMFSTRTIIDNQNPSWEEPAFLLVTSDEIESGESLRLRICDSDRFSADDAVGQVEVELAELLEHTTGLDEPMRRTDPLQADRPGMRVQGRLTWSVRFAPLWQMPPEELNARMKEIKTARKGENPEPMPWYMDWIARWAGEKPEWAKEREERRQETLAWFTGEKERDELEAMARPSEELRSGILQFHVHQCTDLEVESLDGTYSAKSSARKSAAGGKPALSDVIDRTATENPEPPSAYVEVHLNDRLVYRTRTKQVTPLPYFNAVSERFLRDWRMAKLVFVVRDERDREHDPILGIVSLRLEEVFQEVSQLTRWYPLIGGLGWGRIRLSLLWKPVDIHLPPRISGFEIATLQIKSVSATDLSHLADKKGISVMLETEADRYTLSSDDSEGVASRPPSISLASPMSARQTPIPVPVDGEEAEMEWELERPIRLAVEYRHSCSVLISFITRSGVMRKKRVVGLASVRLNDAEDWTTVHRTVPIFATSVVKDAIVAGQAYADVQAGAAGLSLSRLPSRDTQVLGFVSLEFGLRPGVSRAHARLAKKDLRFKRVFEAWELEREVRRGLSEMGAKDAMRADATLSHAHAHAHVRDKMHLGKGGGHEDDEDDAEGDGESGSESEDEAGGGAGVRRSASGKTTDQRRKEEEDEDDEVFGVSERRAHSHALHKRNKGIFQLKIARTGRFVKDQIEAKLYARAKDRRIRGADLDVEQEGQSKL